MNICEERLINEFIALTKRNGKEYLKKLLAYAIALDKAMSSKRE